MKYLFPFLLTVLLFFAVKQSIELSQLQKEQTILKDDFAEISKINYGLFNMQLWKEKALEVFNARLEDFEIDPQLYTDVNKQLRIYLNEFYEDWITSGKIVDEILKAAEGKINKMFLTLIKGNVGELIKGIDLKSKIPVIADKLTAEIKANEPVFKAYLTDELSSLLFDEEARKYTDPRDVYLSKYEVKELSEATAMIKQDIRTNDKIIKDQIKWLYILLLAGVLLMFISYYFVEYRVVVIGLTLIAIVLLVMGVTLPMIDIDARLNSFQIMLLGTEISFDEQSLYYQSKSILDVTDTLIRSHGIDTKIVGYLVLLFSVIFPFFKLTLSSLYLFVRKVRRSRFAEIVIFYLGKWSMADVFVVAIFMSYIGFHGIVTSQLLNIANNDGGFAVETLNYSRLAPGALFFTSYCILSIITSLIINRKKDKVEGV